MRPLAPVLALAALTILTGCHFSRARVNVPDFYERAEQVEIGKTHADDLPAIFGTPAFQELKLGEEGKKAYVYVFGDAKTESFNMFIFSVGETNSGVDTATFFADENGVIEKTVIGDNSRDLPWDFWAFSDD